MSNLHQIKKLNNIKSKMETKSQTSMTVQKKPKSVSRSKLLSKICCCTKIYEVDAVQISSGYFKSYVVSLGSKKAQSKIFV